MAFTQVAGRKAADVVLYALSTCPWCRRTKDLLNNLGVEYSYVDVDLAAGDERAALVAEVRKWNPAMSMPTMVIDGKQVIVGLREAEIRAALGDGA